MPFLQWNLHRYSRSYGDRSGLLLWHGRCTYVYLYYYIYIYLAHMFCFSYFDLQHLRALGGRDVCSQMRCASPATRLWVPTSNVHRRDVNRRPDQAQNYNAQRVNALSAVLGSLPIRDRFGPFITFFWTSCITLTHRSSRVQVGNSPFGQ